MEYSSLESLKKFFDSSVKGLNCISPLQLRTDMLCPLILLEETLAGLTKLIFFIHIILFLFCLNSFFLRSLFHF